MKNVKYSSVLKIVLYIAIAIGIIAFISNNSLIADIGTAYYVIFLGILFITMIAIPLFVFFVKIVGIRDYMIKKGRHYSRWYPIFKGFIGYGSKKYSITLKLYSRWFEKQKDDIQLLNQVNKIFGINYGLPSISTSGLVHKNSVRIGVKLGEENDKEVILVAYVRQGENIRDFEIGRYKKDMFDMVLFFDIKHCEIGVYDRNSNRYVVWKNSEIKNPVDIKSYGYFLPRPYFGGKAKAFADLAVKLFIRKFDE
jgi:hypothetical protein